MQNEVDMGWNLKNTYAQLPKIFYTNINPTPVNSPKLIIFNDELAKSLGLNGDGLKSYDGIQILSGNKTPPNTIPIAQAYAGHQFGHFTMLGDGRAVLIGEQMTPTGELMDIQLKGSGRTPYSRSGDGRASLGPMLREYIISEAMYELGIPSSRSLSVVTTGEMIMRMEEELGAILTRVSSSHIRVGTFEYIARWGNREYLKKLADYTIKRHFPYINYEDEPYLRFLEEVIKLQAILISKWQLVGFVHGVMNTDNMAISGETIDYGPCAFIDTYIPNTVFSSIDRYGRYAYDKQPIIANWNLARFAETLLPLLDKNEEKAIEIAQDKINSFMELYEINWLNGMRKKLGIFNSEENDEILIMDLLDIMEKYNADYTNTFIALTFEEYKDMSLFESVEFKDWRKRWKLRLKRQEKSKESIIELMKNANPALIPRNHRVEEALKVAVEYEDYSKLKKFLKALKKPYEHRIEQIEYSTPAPKSNKPYRTFCGT